MIGRRQFLQFGPATLGGAWALNWHQSLAAFGSAETYVLSRGIFDERFEESRTFGSVLASRGMRTTALKGDIANLWYDDLRSQLRKSPGPFAGLTDRASLFCLEELARDVGMRVVTRIDHLIDHAGRVQHDAAGPTSVAEALRPLDARESFGHLAALLVMQRDTQISSNPNAQKRSGAAAPIGTIPLATWVIA